MPAFDQFNFNPKKIQRGKIKVPRLTKKQEHELLVKAYNNQYNEIFKLHHFLVECEYTNHSIDSGNPIDDAIELIGTLLEEQLK